MTTFRQIPLGWTPCSAVKTGNWASHPIHRIDNNEFRITDHLIGLVVALHIATVAALKRQSSLLPAQLGAAIKNLASYTFSIYLFHYPLLIFFAGAIPGPANDLGHRAALLVTTALAIFGLAQISDKSILR